MGRETPAGWYPDPEVEPSFCRLRYWDGEQWTDEMTETLPASPPPRPPSSRPRTPFGPTGPLPWSAEGTNPESGG